MASARTNHKLRQQGLTLLELVIVLAVLVALAGLIVPLLSSVSDDAAETVTRESLARIRDAISGAGGYQAAMRYAVDEDTTDPVGYATGLPWPAPDDVAGGRLDHPQLVYLFEEPTGLDEFDPTTRVGWPRPMLEISASGRFAVDPGAGYAASYGENDDPAPLDGWGRAIVIQLPDTEAGVTDAETEAVRLVSPGFDGIIDTPTDTLAPTAEQINDDLLMYLRIEDPNL